MIFFTLYTTLIKERLNDLIEWSFEREGLPYLACNDRNAFFTSEYQNRYKLWSSQNMYETLTYLLDNIFVRFGPKLYRQIVDIPMGSNCAPLIADLFLFCYEILWALFLTLSYNREAEIIQAFRYLDDLLHIDNPYYEVIEGRMYPPELQLN